MSKKVLIIILASVLLVSAMGAGVSLAYLLAKTPSIENNFEPVYVSCSIVEDFDGSVKKDVKVKNTGDINAYIRATFVVMWIFEDGSVYAETPIENTDYTVVLGSSLWTRGKDGFYYYSAQVSSGEATEILISSLSQISAAPEGCKLFVHVAATAIQAEPNNAVAQAWGVTVSENGALKAP